MKKIIAVFSVAILLAGCSQKDPTKNLADGKCVSALADSVATHISAQIDALAAENWELAHSFASDNFQANVSVDDFSLIISAQYSMLVDNSGYRFNECSVAGGTINQKVTVRSSQQDFMLTYTLSVNGSSLGVESAVVSESASEINA
jgi:PBP1b-binding outer membrane lipoprotein LpoB